MDRCTCLEWEAARILVSAGAVLRGEFVLSSGEVSDLYIDARSVLGDRGAYAALLGLLAGAGYRHLSRADAVVGVATGGIPWAAGLAQAYGLPLGYVRPRAKGHGRGRRLEGWSGPGRAVLVDDVATTGGSLASAVEALREAGVEVETALVIVDREAGAGERLAGLDVVLAPLTRLSVIRRLLGEAP